MQILQSDITTIFDFSVNYDLQLHSITIMFQIKKSIQITPKMLDGINLGAKLY